jgi:hypothetical protein
MLARHERGAYPLRGCAFHPPNIWPGGAPAKTRSYFSTVPKSVCLFRLLSLFAANASESQQCVPKSELIPV